MNAAAVDQSSTAARVFAALIALLAIAGILLFLQAEIEKSGSFWQSVGVLSRFFTILSNVLVALVFGLVALGVQVRPRVVAGTVLAIVLVGVVYELLLKGLVDLTAGSAVANVLLHRVTPILAPVFWALFTPKGTLRYADPALWAAFPFAYLGYALVRGVMEGKYAYPFIDIAALGAVQVAINAVVIGAGFFAVGAALVWLDRRLGASR
jgi:hypothetical protein